MLWILVMTLSLIDVWCSVLPRWSMAKTGSQGGSCVDPNSFGLKKGDIRLHHSSWDPCKLLSVANLVPKTPQFSATVSLLDFFKTMIYQTAQTVLRRPHLYRPVRCWEPGFKPYFIETRQNWELRSETPLLWMYASNWAREASGFLRSFV